ncbi:uncharacterized protein LOC100891818 isoform X2 [Strongylocentrotus purpuratus]|uniref:Uncharacterized protein n=1 Tax=Strongylocentrotus purpuratus TaxID=7668 RepID=A0A7M7NH76_STRPU|nr:uncharacterized protein LOC100891818 isoform X2 [Strongylocentrotus purpuratus]
MYNSEKQRMSVGLGVPPGDDMVGVETKALPPSPRSPMATPFQEPPKRATYGSVLNDFADSTTAHGLPRVISEGKWYWKIFWFLVFSGATYVFCRQAWDILTDYRSNPVNTNIKIQTRTYVDFPAVTVCNMNRMRRSKMVGTRFEGLIEIDGGFDDDGDSAYSWWFDFSSDFWNEYYSSGYSWGAGGGGGGSLGSSGGGSLGGSGGGMGSRKKRAMPYDNLFQDFESVPDDTTDEETVIEPNPQYKGARRFIHGERVARGASSSSSSYGGGGGGGSSSYGGGGGGGSSSYGGGGGGYGGSSSWGGGGGGGGWSSSYAWGTSSSWGWGGGYASSTYWNSWFDDWDSWGSELWGSFQFEFDDYYAWEDLVDGESDWQGFYDNSRSEDFSDIIDVANPTRVELEELGHQPEDFILQCTFDKRNCNYTDFKMFQNKVYGNCFTFNHGRDNQSIIETSKSGSTYGLHLTLFIEQPEYVGIFSQESGVRVAIHDPNVIPLPEDDGITSPTGTATSIGIRQNLILRQGGKYGNCTEDGVETPYQPVEFSYSTLGCKRQCLLDEMYDRCGCVDDIIEDLDLAKCSYFNSTQQRCRQLIQSLNDEGKLDCYCPNACTEMNYLTSTSTSLWPSERYEEHLYTRIAAKNDIAARILQSVEATRKNLARIRIYFEELNFQSVEEIPAYTFGSFLGGVGGLLGLYIGFSVVTISEIILLFLFLLKHTFCAAFCNTKVQPVHT